MNFALNRLRELLAPLGVLGGIAAAFGALALFTMAWCFVLFVQAVFTPGSVKLPPEGSKAKRLETFQAAIDQSVGQIDGRSMFFTPQPPNKPEAPPEKKDEPPPQPTVYGGPAIIAMVDDKVWFDDGRILTSGHAPDDGLKVVRVSPPWLARLEWKGVEFDVTLFTRTTSEFLRKQSDK